MGNGSNEVHGCVGFPIESVLHAAIVTTLPSLSLDIALLLRLSHNGGLVQVHLWVSMAVIFVMDNIMNNLYCDMNPSLPIILPTHIEPAYNHALYLAAFGTGKLRY
jgi:hypothetical protein